APFIITRVVPGSLTLPLGENPQDYNIYIDGKESSVAANGSFAGEVPLDGFALVWAYRSEQQTALTKIVFPDESEIALTPRSTAEAMVLMTPPLFSKDLDLLRAAYSTFAQIPELEQFSTLVASAIQAGRDFLDDPRLEDVWSRAVSSATEKRVLPAPGLAAH